MGNVFDFSGIEKSEQTIRKTWNEFRECLANGLFSYNEIEKAKKQTFLKVYDDLFHKHSGIDHKTIALKALKGKLIGRGTILKMMKFPIMSVFFLKKSTSKKIIVLVLLM